MTPRARLGHSEIVTARRLALGLALLALLVSPAPPARAGHRLDMGVGACDGAETGEFSPGEVVEIEACLTQSDEPLGGRPVVFLEAGPSPADLRETATDDLGRARFAFSSPRTGRSRVGMCDQDQCFGPIVIVWADPQVGPPIQEPFTAPPLQAPPGGGSGIGEPRLAGLAPVGDGAGFTCREGPGGAEAVLPGFASIVSTDALRVRNPRTGAEGDAVRITTRQSLLVGSVIHGTPALAFVSLAEPGNRVDRDGPFPYRGYNRLLVLWANGDIRWGKQEFALREGRWVEQDPSFTVTLRHEETTFISDGPAFESRAGIAAGTRAGNLCDGDGYPSISLASPAPPEGPPRSRAPVAVLAGVAVLLLMGALAIAVMRASEPPGRIAVEVPGGPRIRWERTDIRYDQWGRPVSYLDVVELPDGRSSTVRTRISQEALIVDEVDFLDSGDWEDPTLTIKRRDLHYDLAGRPTAYTEDVFSDGATHRSRISGISYDAAGRVQGYARSTTVILGTLGESEPRLERVAVEHEGLPREAPRGARLARIERIERSDLRYDSEGHVSGYVSASTTDGAGEIREEASGPVFLADLPRVLLEIGEGAPPAPAFVSEPIRGLARARRVLTRWFRRHACKVEVSLADPQGDPLPRAVIRFGERAVRMDHRGRQRVWVLERGNYALSGEEGMAPGVLGWVVVRAIPGQCQARCTTHRISE